MPPDAVTLPSREKRPLGRLFHILFYTPVAIAVASIAMTALRSVDRNLPPIGLACFVLNLPAMLFCAVICAIIAAKRRTADFGLLTFVGAASFYLVVVLVGARFLRYPTHI